MRPRLVYFVWSWSALIVFLIVWPTVAFGALPERYDGIVSDARISPARGFYFNPTTVTISASTPGAKVAVTIDGSEPTVASAFLAGSNLTLHLTNSTVVRVRAFRERWQPSAISTHSYIFPESVAAQQGPVSAGKFWQDRTDRVHP